MQIKIIVKPRGFLGKKRAITLGIGNERLKSFIYEKALDFISKEVVKPYIKKHFPKAKNYTLVEDNLWKEIKEL